VAASYSVRIAAPRQRVWGAMMHADLTQLPIARRLMALRTFGRRKPPKVNQPRTLADFGSAAGKKDAGGFQEITRVPEEEIVIGIVGKFWRPDAPVFRDWMPEDFAALAPQGQAKAAWNFYLEDSGDSTILSTETRVLCCGTAARIKFRIYWLLIGFFSGLIRKEMLQMIKKNAEI
jgi:hypothetical protein